MSWKEILKSSSSIRRNWINSKTPPDMYYYDKLNPKLKKEFDEVFEKLIDDIQRGYLSQEEEMRGNHKTENVQGRFYLRDLIDDSTGNHFANFKFEIAPTMLNKPMVFNTAMVCSSASPNRSIASRTSSHLL